MSNTFEPKITVVIPVYNGEKYMKDAIDSALNQTYKNIEVLVVNDGSKDSTDEIAKSYGDKIKYIKKENGGVASALNVAIQNMSGEYFSWLSHDDLYVNTKVEKQVQALSSLENKDTIVVCNVDIVQFSLELIRHNHIPNSVYNNVPGFLALDQSIGLNGCALLISKKLFDKHGLFNEKLKVTQDYDMWFRFAKAEQFTFIEDNLVLSRQHPEQGSKTMKEVDTEVDTLHERFVNNLTEKEFMNYIGNDIENALQYYKQYLEINCKKTAVAILLIYIRIVKEKYGKEKAIHYLNEKLFMNADITVNNDLFENIEKTDKKKIVFYNTVWVTGGIERVLLKLFESLSPDYDIVFISSNISKNEGYPIPKYIKTIQMNHAQGDNISLSLLFACKLVNADLFIGNQNLDEYFIKSYQLFNQANIKTIACNHYNYFLPFEIKFCNKIASVRHYYYKYVDVATWATKTSTHTYNCITPNGYYLPNPNTFEVMNTKKENFNKNILCVGRFDDLYKRLDLTLKAFKLILEKIPEAKLTVVGNCDLNMKFPNNETIQDILNDLKIPEENIEFVGKQNDVEKYYMDSSLFLLTSETEGFGMVLNEAATFGVPSITFNIPGIDDLILDSKNGYIVPMHNVQEMANKAIYLLMNSKQLKEFSDNALEHVKEFELSKLTVKWKELINIALSEEKYIAEYSEDYSKIIKQYERELLGFFNSTENVHQILDQKDLPGGYEEVYKGTYLHRLNYYIKTYGMMATIKKILSKVKNKLLK